MTLYQFLVFIHIFSAILGVGPGFILTFIVTKSTTMAELRHAFSIRGRLHIFVMVGGILLLVTGLWMGLINTGLFHQGWYVLSLLLFFVVLGAGPIVLSPLSKPIKTILKEHKGESIPKQYKELSKKLFFYEHITNIILFIIIVLMVLKPF